MVKLSELLSRRSEALSLRYSDYLKENIEAVIEEEARGITPLPRVLPDEFLPDFISPSVFGVEIDTDDISIPFGIQEIGLLAQTENGVLTEEVLDTAINMVLSNVSVILEFKPDVAVSDFKHLVSTSAAIKSSLSFLPETSDDDTVFEAYCKKMEDLTRAFLNQPNMSQHVLPVSSYIFYMYLEILNPEIASDFQPDDLYILENFHEKMSVARSDYMKSKIRAVVFEHFGGEESFRDFALEMFASISESVKEMVIDEASRISVENPAKEDETAVSE